MLITPGGKKHENETAVECLKREMSEEINCTLNSYVFLNTYSAPSSHYSLIETAKDNDLHVEEFLNNLYFQILILNKSENLDYTLVIYILEETVGTAYVIQNN
ncbi:hypothetical protein [Fluviispira vulneris]|uniref:hypothetical protein n=1 Tax=Fluviispira vulneris TaxID=2763012 RepID=UPI001645B959|nr:hypothetical protein [Fluviispira vulneris]